MSRHPRHFDLFAIFAAAVAAGVLGAYVTIMREQGDRPVVWFVAASGVGIALAAYGAVRSNPRRITALVGSGLVLMALGVLGLLTIGLPLVLAGCLALVAAIRGGAATTVGTHRT